MDGYLFDTNHVRYWFDGNERLLERAAALPPGSPIYISVVTMGEIRYGLEVMPRRDRQGLEGPLLQFVADHFPVILPLTEATTLDYGELRAALYEKYCPLKERRSRRPEQLSDPLTSLTLQIQENDLWIAAHARERGLVLLTSDRMNAIREVASQLRVDDWTR